MAKVIIGAEVKVDGLDKAGQSVGSFKKQLKEATNDLQTMADKFGLNSKEAAAAAMKVAGLKDAIGDAKALADTFNPDKKFVALGGAVQGVVAGFSAFTGAMGLLGSESKEVEQLLLKVQSAMALQQGLSGIAGAVDSFKLLGATIVDKVVTAFSTLKGALIASGIGALAVGVGLLIANFDKLKESLGFASKVQQAYNDTLSDFQNGAKSAIEKTNEVRTAFDNARAGVISKKQALDTYNTTLGDTLGKAKSLEEAEDIYNKKAAVYIQIMGLKAQANALFAKSADEAAKGIVAANDDNLSFFDKAKAGVLQYLGFTNKAVGGLIVAQKEATEEIQANAKLNSEVLYQEGLKLGAQAEQLSKDNAIKITQVEDVKHAVLKEKAVKAAVDLFALRKEYQAKELQSIIDYAAELAAEDARAAQAKIDGMYALQEMELQAKADLAELALLDDPDSIDNRLAKEQADFELEMLQFQGNNVQRQILEKQHSDAIVAIKAEEVEAKRLIGEKEVEYANVLAGGVANALDTLAGIAGKQTAAGKALAIASTVIKTIQGGIAAFTGMTSSIPGPVGIALGVVAAAGVVAAGVKAVQQITAVKIPGVGGGGSAPSISLPKAPPLTPQAQTTRLDQQSINAVGNAAQRNYVLETDVSGNQERIRRLNRAARIN
jgi:hypothetical protein